MTIHMRTDGDGVVHQVWAQRQANSCAVAAIWMARGIGKQMSFSEGEWDLAWRTYHNAVIQHCTLEAPPAPMSLDPRMHAANQETFQNMFASFGTFAQQVAMMLRTEGLTVTHSANAGTAQTLTTSRLGGSKCAVVLVGWYSGSGAARARSGGHFVVAAKVNRSGQIVYLDPWGGVLQELPNNARYPTNGLIEEIIYVSP